ncbi:enoyl-CoA hydratase/isomerase family protein [Gordonia caeni]|uniref:3-hydroxyisobutyryl-CoA hydrolase n=1 Tax=Gordonia caeni TaxID=1007097 RepID=A0ABP7NWL9_9ACTN
MSRPNEVEPPVLAAVRGGLGTLTLNRPASINALDHEMVALMTAALHEWAVDPGVRAVVVDGAGDRGLCAGGDIVAIHRDAAALQGADDEAVTDSASAAFWRDEYRMNADIAEYPKPYVAIMDGIVMGGGVGISGHANTRIVTDRTRLAMPEVGIGLVPDVGGTRLLSQVPDQLGTYAALTSVHLRGADAMALGLADHYVPADRLDEFRAALAERPVDEALAEHAVTPPPSALAAQRDWIAEVFAADTVAEIVENCRATGRPEAVKAAETIAGKSPTALTVTLAALRAAATERSLREALRREYRTSIRCVAHPDLAEGIRAQVIDKDRNPAWQPGRLDQLTGDEAAAFLAPLPAGLELTYPQR